MTENITGHSEFDATDGLIKLMVGMVDAAATAEASKSVVPMEHTGTETEIVLKRMLTENTGVSILDSGFDNGRNWQQNQGRDFDSEPVTSLKFSTYRNSDGYTKADILCTLNVYHWLKDRLEIATELDTIFHGRFRKEFDPDDDKYWLELMEEFPKYLAKLRENEGEIRFEEFGGIYGDGEPITVNTYSGDNLVDQVLQYVLFTNKTGEYIALQIHGGADVRGGYTKPRIFEFGHMGEYDIIDNAKANICCSGEDRLPEAVEFFEKQKTLLNRLVLPGMEGEFRESFEEIRAMLLELENSSEHNWSTDDSSHWYFQGSYGAGAEPQLEKYEVVDLEDEDNEQKWEPGKLCIKDGNGYCPYCGAKLAASPY
jgi:hypothetical protein